MLVFLQGTQPLLDHGDRLGKPYRVSPVDREACIQQIDVLLPGAVLGSNEFSS